jgi:CO dehydrogenase nickel-insertion accessory protein CooC1
VLAKTKHILERIPRSAVTSVEVMRLGRQTKEGLGSMCYMGDITKVYMILLCTFNST